MPHVDPSTVDDHGPRFIVAEQGLGPALIHYFVRSRVEGEVAVGEWPPSSSFDEGPVRRYIMRIPELPKRMRPLMAQTPGLTTFLPAGPGVAVEMGYRHPVALRACPPSPWRNVTATWIQPTQISLLRRIAYALPHQTILRTQVALTQRGAFLRSNQGIEAVPLGMFFVEIHPNLYIPAGYDVTPAVAPEVLYRALGAAPSQVLFIDTRAHAIAVEEGAFSPLETALLEAQAWEPLVADAIQRALEEAPVHLKLEPLGMFALSQVQPPPTAAGAPPHAPQLPSNPPR
jgi:hypothetical protein